MNSAFGQIPQRIFVQRHDEDVEGPGDSYLSAYDSVDDLDTERDSNTVAVYELVSVKKLRLSRELV